jgi:hypothetical protein
LSSDFLSRFTTWMASNCCSPHRMILPPANHIWHGRTLSVALGAVTVLGATAEHMLQVAHTPVTSHVDLAGQGSNANVEPIGILRGQLAVDT